jgi:alanyl-tRNA synthetase
VNERIRLNTRVEIQANVPIAEATAQGAMALFGEKYGEAVRVVTIDPAYSIELCGGTHVGATGSIGLFKITSESSVAAGVRRIEAITAGAAEAYVFGLLNDLAKAKETLKTTHINKAIESLMVEQNQLKKQIEQLMIEKANAIKIELLEGKKNINGIDIVTSIIDLDHAEALKTICFQLKNENKNLVVVLGTLTNGKPMIHIAISDDLIASKGYNASTMIKQVSKHIQGGGGGQGFYASAGGTLAAGLQPAIDATISLL